MIIRDNMAIVVRDYLDTDLEAVNNILGEAFSIKKANFSSPEFHELVASIDNQVGGYLLMTKVLNPIKNKYYYLIDYVSVSSEYRKMGIGKKLLEEAEKIAREEGAMYLQLTCGYQRIAAHKLYENSGFIKRESDIFRKELV